MKRFAKTISLAACLVFLCGAVAMAANRVYIEDKTVAPNAAGQFLGVFVDNDIDINGIVIPLEIRSIDAGSYALANATWGFGSPSRVQASPLGPANPAGCDSDGDPSDCTWPAGNITNRRIPTPEAAAPCGGKSGTSWNTGSGMDGISPDALLFASVSTGDPTAGHLVVLPAGTDPVGQPSFRIGFSATGVQGYFMVDTTCVKPANHLAFTYTDVGGGTVALAPAFDTGLVHIFIPPNNCPAFDQSSPFNVAATTGSQACATVSAHDSEGNTPITFAKVSGPVSATVVGNQVCYTPDCNDVANGVNVVVSATDALGNTCSDSNLTVHFNVTASQLTIQCSDESGHWGTVLSQSPVIAGGCPPYSLSIVSGPGEIDVLIWDYPTGCPDVGDHAVTLRATDAVGSTAVCNFTASVTNQVPECSNIPPNLPGVGGVHSVDLGDVSQIDGDALTYTYLGGLPPTWLDEQIVGDQFTATRPAGDGGSYTVSYSVFDGCARIICSFDVIFENPCVKVVKQGTDSAYGCALNGTQATVCIVAADGAVPGAAGGYDLLICYDQSGLSFLGATGGPPGWEYFTYRTGMLGGNCGGGCPDGFVRLISIADMNNGHTPAEGTWDIDGDVLACLTFLVTSDRNFINTCLHVGFCSYDCGDNVFSDSTGNIVWTPRDGVSFGPNYDCPEDPKVDYVPAVSYCPGAICVCEPPDDRGDLNMNGIANEIGDAVLYTNYFIYGSEVWCGCIYEQGQILASDINDDGIVLTVADLIYLIRIITGDESPFPPGTGSGSPKVSPYANSVDVHSNVSNGAVTVRTNSSVDIGAALLVFRYSGVSVGAPVLANNSGLSIRSNAANGELRVLVSQTVEAASTRLNAGSNSLVNIPISGEGSFELVETQFSDYNGALLSVTAASAAVPTSYALEQNYPNPFNAGTVIPFTLVEGSRYELTIYNVAGQMVRTFSGEGSVGLNRVEWNGRTADGIEAATGMYFYRVTTPHFSATKKMVLLK